MKAAEIKVEEFIMLCLSGTLACGSVYNGTSLIRAVWYIVLSVSQKYP